MSDKNDGGPAFPFGQVSEVTGQVVNGYHNDGMSLRDYFAAKAMQGDLANSDGGYLSLNATAEQLYKNASTYYRMADAMLKAREQ